MVKNYKLPRKYYKSRKYNGKCEKCGCVCEHPYSYIDGNNIAITYNAPYLCKKCFDEMYRNKKHA